VLDELLVEDAVGAVGRAGLRAGLEELGLEVLVLLAQFGDFLLEVEEDEVFLGLAGLGLGEFAEDLV
jgi:hypothetical protein